MKRGSWLIFILILLLALVACNDPDVPDVPDVTPVPTEAPSPTESPEASNTINLLVVADGEVELMREGWSEFHPTTFGAVLSRGDQIRVSDSAQAVVFCDNLMLWEVPRSTPTGLTGCPRTEESQFVRRNGRRVGNPRASSEDVPYLISPRATSVLDDQPLLRWHAVPGATSYTVSVSGTDWETETSDSQVRYDGEPLEAGKDYLLKVVADNGKSSENEGPKDLGFRVLSQEEVQRVGESADKIRALDLSNEAKSLALAHFYAGQCDEDERCLISDAINQLNALEGHQSSAVYRLLGDLYVQIQLTSMAQEPYLQAIDLAKAAGDLEAEADALVALATMYENTSDDNKKQQVIGWLERALENYQTIGDTLGTNEAQEKLQKLAP